MMKAFRDAVGGALFLLPAFLAGQSTGQSLNLTTSYPIPNGVYNQIVTVGDAGFGAANTILNQNAGDTLLVPPTNPNGRVGVGTSNPLSTLSVGGDGYADAAVYAGGNVPVTQGGGPYGPEYYAGGSIATGLWAEGQYLGLALQSTSDSGTAALLKGNTGGFISGRQYGSPPPYSSPHQIGLSATGTDIGVLSQFQILAYAAAPVYSIGITGDAPEGGYGVYCNARWCRGTVPWSSPSDARLKKNIKTIEGALGKTLRLRGVDFEWKDGREEGTRMGFIAQEAREVAPEVMSKDMEGYYSMSAGSLTALLTEAVKEQQREIDSQDKAIDALQAEVGSLEAKRGSAPRRRP